MVNSIAVHAGWPTLRTRQEVCELIIQSQISVSFTPGSDRLPVREKIIFYFIK